MAYITTVTVTIDRPVELVYDALMNPDNLKHWLTGFISLSPLSGTPGEPGSTSLMKVKEGGKEMEVTERILQVHPLQQYTFRIEHASFESETDIRFLPKGNSTDMMQSVQFTPKGFMIKLMMPMIKGAMKKRMEGELMRFKQFVENN